MIGIYPTHIFPTYSDTQSSGVLDTALKYVLVLNDENNSNRLVLYFFNGTTLRMVAGGNSGGSSVSFVFNETPVGAVNGSNADFTSAFDFVPESVNVKINGMDQKPVTHFITSGNRNIHINDSPQPGEIILIDYIKN